MTVDVETGSGTHRVEVRRDGERWVVAIDGREVRVDVAVAGDRWSLLIDGRSYEAAVDDRGNGALVVHVDGEAIPLVVNTGRGSRPGRRRDGAGVDSTAAHISAPMPGRVVKVLVKPGDTVAARQGIVIVEAMKMENELRAPRDGVVAEVRVAEGSSVEANTVLVTLE